MLSSLVGKAAPPLKLTDLQGHPVDLEAERGNAVLLNFFSAW
jgi:peroxiredoxin